MTYPNALLQFDGLERLPGEPENSSDARYGIGWVDPPTIEHVIWTRGGGNTATIFDVGHADNPHAYPVIKWHRRQINADTGDAEAWQELLLATPEEMTSSPGSLSLYPCYLSHRLMGYVANTSQSQVTAVTGWLLDRVFRPGPLVPFFGAANAGALLGTTRIIDVPGWGVYVVGAGNSGAYNTSCGISYYPRISPDALPSFTATAGIHIDNIGSSGGTTEFIGHDSQGRVYFLRKTTSFGDARIMCFSPGLTGIAWEVTLEYSVDYVPGQANSTLADNNFLDSRMAITADGNLLVAGSPIMSVLDISDPGRLETDLAGCFLGLVYVGENWSSAKSTGYRAIDTCRIWFPNPANAMWRIGDCAREFDCDNVGVDQIVYDLARRAGLPPGRIDVSGIELAEDYGRIAGFGIGRSASARTMIEILQRHSFFDVTEIGGIVAARRRDRAPDGVIGGDDLRAHAYGETPPTLARRERIEDYEIPAEVRVEYSQLNAEYEPGVEAYTRRVTDASGVLDVDLSSIAMEPDEAAVIAEATLLEAVVARESIESHQVATDANKALKPGDIKTLEVGDREDVIRITDIGYAYPGIQRLKMLRHDPSVYSSDARGVGRGTSGSVVVQHGATTFELLDAPLVRELDDVPGYFAAMGGIPTIPGVIEGWPGGDLSREETGGPVDILRMFRPACWFGTTVTALPADAPHTAIDWRPVDVTTSGPLETVTLQEALAGRNFAAVEVREAGFGARIGWELIRFLEADYDSEEGWSINGLLRGVNGTEWAIGLHQAGDRLVVLNNMAQVLTDFDTELGTFWEHNAATIGGEPDPAAAVTFGWFGVDRIPYAPCHLEAERDGSSVFIRWTRRDRVGMELQNGQTLPLSEESESYVVTIFNALGNAILRTATVSTPEYEYTSANELADFGSQQASLNISVAQVGALGPGYAASGLIPVEGDAATPPPLPSGDQSRVVITVGGTFDADDTLYLNLQFLEAGVGWHNETFTATGGGKSAIGDYLTDLSAQVGAAFPSLTRSIVGSELTISTTAGTLTGTVTNNTAVVSASLEQEAAPASAGVTYVGTLDFYQSAGGSDVIGPSLSTQYGQGGSLTARLEVVGITYDAAKAIGPGNLAQFNVASSHDFGGEAVSHLAPLGPSVTAIDANGGFATYKNSVQLGTISGTPSPPPRAGVAITLNANYRLANQFWQTTPVNVSPSLSPLKYLVKTNRNAEPAFPSGAEQIILVGFTSAGDQVATPQSVVAGQVYKITLGATEFSHTVTSGDAADQRRESILQALADDIDADADFVVDLFTANRPDDDPLAPGTFITQIEIRHADPDTAFAFDAQASYGIEVTVVNEIVPE